MKKINLLKKDQLKYGAVVAIIVIAVVAFVIYTKSPKIFESNLINHTDEKVDTNSNTEEELIELANELLEKYNITYYDEYGDERYVLYEKKELDISNLPQYYIKETALKQLDNKNKFKRKALKETVKKLYGPDVTVTNESFITSNCQKYEYNETTTVYENKGIISCTHYNQNETLKTKLLTVKKEKEDLLVNVAVAVVDSDNKEVSLPTGKIVEELNADTFDIDKDSDKVSEYQYMFAYNKKEKNYYLKSLKRVSPPIKKNIKTTDIDSQSNEVKELYNIITRLAPYYYTYTNTPFQGKNITVQNIDNMYKLFMIYTSNESAEDIEIPASLTGGYISSKIPKESFEKKYIDFFGEEPTKYTFDDYHNLQKCNVILYDNKTESYFSFTGACGGTSSLSTKIELFSVDEKDNELKLSVKVMFLKDETVNENNVLKHKYSLYLDSNINILLKEYTNVDANEREDFFEELYDDLPIYTFTFEKQPTGNYVLKAISPNN